MASTLRWFAGKVIGGFRRRIFLPRVEAAGDALLVQVRLNIGIQGPPHSRPGEFPRRITGYMARAVSVDVDEQNLSAKVYVDLNRLQHDFPYPYLHERGDRPFLSRTLREMRPKIRRKLTVG